MMHLPGRFLFIHIPRTGGTSIKAALSSAFPEAIINNAERKHWTAWDLRWNMSVAEWETYYRFTVIRDPWALIESDWRYCRNYARRTPYSSDATNPLWQDKLRRTLADDFISFVRQEWLGRFSPLRAGGFRRTWCLGPSGEKIGVHVWPYERLVEDWPALCQAIGLSVEPPLPQLNAAPAERIQWPEAERRGVGELCWMDLL